MGLLECLLLCRWVIRVSALLAWEQLGSQAPLLPPNPQLQPSPPDSLVETGSVSFLVKQRVIIAN